MSGTSLPSTEKNVNYFKFIANCIFGAKPRVGYLVSPSGSRGIKALFSLRLSCTVGIQSLLCDVTQQVEAATHTDRRSLGLVPYRLLSQPRVVDNSTIWGPFHNKILQLVTYYLPLVVVV